ncbi:mammalian ependymin-related protein 1-like [Dreissena polymorpha]|uniref:Uncharacterized protein n=1 Tax=Dreissena polymorpha TaxID=45954 RepID=A0A9D4KTT1_DREPO|nr:mammalian ependymin-related protein 1-like [Dreissena polymorpha]KAH3845975.1 hypothetical protein DPMN_088270 [Dreissena polymorpha]
MLKFVVLAALVAVCAAQVPVKCDSPKQWEARRYRMDRTKQYAELAYHSYDAIYMRTRSVEEVDQGTERDYYDRLHLHNVGVEYVLNLRTKKCNITRNSDPFRTIGIPPDARFVFEATIGAAGIPSEYLIATTWEGSFPDGAQYAVTVAEPDCIPIGFDVANNKTSETFHERYFDLHLGIADPEVFIPPQECLQQH